MRWWSFWLFLAAWYALLAIIIYSQKQPPQQPRREVTAPCYKHNPKSDVWGLCEDITPLYEAV